MPQRLESVSRFSPGNCAPELLESMLVGRGDLVNRLEKSVLDSVETDAGHHWLLIGPRGSGKTHLLAILYNRIDRNPGIRSRVVIAYMKEEERGVASYLDWLVRILRALHRWNEKSPPNENIDVGQELESLTRLPLDQARAAAERLVLRFVGDRRLLLVTENLGEIFDETKGMGEEGQRRFRDLVQQYPIWTIVASSQALFEDIQAREAPFYGFFKVSHLGMFDVGDSVSLLQKLAELEGRTQLREFFDTEVGRGRVRAIHQLTGGNPRLLVIFYQFVDRESIDDLASPFLEMVDSLTSYYQEQMQPLPALQQKIVEFLCEQRAPAAVKEIARSCFITHQTASKQLNRLAERRYVIATAVGRESFYELREPLFRICFEVKENLGYPIRLFVDFLGQFYSMEELKRKYRSTSLLRSLYESGGLAPLREKADVELGYIGEALSAYYSARLDAPLCKPERETISRTVDDLLSENDYREAVKLAETAFELKFGGSEFLLKSADGRRNLGDLRGARERLDRVVRLEPENLEAWTKKATIEVVTDGLDAAEQSFQQVLALDDRNELALVSLGAIKGDRGEYSEALRYFCRATEVAPDRFYVWHLRGFEQENTGDLEGARQSYEKAIELAPDSADTWEARGRLLWKQSEHRTALECFERVTKLRPDYGEGWWLLGVAQQNTGQAAAARKSYERAAELAPENARVWLLLGLAQEKAEDFHSAETSFEKSTDLDSDNLLAWASRAVLAAKLDNRDAAKEYLRTAEDLEAGSAFELIRLGEAYRALGFYDEEIRCYGQLLELDPEDCYDTVRIALTFFEFTVLDMAMQIETAAKAGEDQDWSRSLTIFIAEINEHLLRNVELHRLPDLLVRQRLIFEDSPLQGSFIQGLTGALMELLKKHEEIPDERLLAVRDRLIPGLSGAEELSVACRLFATGVSYLETQDIRVLLQLPREERQSLEEILKPAS